MSQFISRIEVPKVSVAPMVDRTDRHYRYFIRQITKRTMLYTEMITSQAILNGNKKLILDFDPLEKPLSLQIAGCNPDEIYKAIKAAEAWDYDEINLNAGCPSDRIAGNEMGATLMAYPRLVKEMVEAIRAASNKPVTVKHRIGIDGRNVLSNSIEKQVIDKYEDMVSFIQIVNSARVDRFIIHARIAILQGLSPRENREVPPLRYEDVYRFKKEFEEIKVEINGGIKSVKEMEQHLNFVDGVMIGRAAYDNPFMLIEADRLFKGGNINLVSRRDIIERMMPYVAYMEERKVPANHILNHMQGLFYDKKGSKMWKQIINPASNINLSGIEKLKEALQNMPQEVLDEMPGHIR